MSTNVARVVRLSRDDASDSAMVPDGEPDLVHVLGGSSLVALDGRLCGLFAVDIVGFNGMRRDDDIQMYVHKSLYEMLQAAFDRSDVPWSGACTKTRG